MKPEASQRMAHEIAGSQLALLKPAKHMGLIGHHTNFSRYVSHFALSCCLTKRINILRLAVPRSKFSFLLSSSRRLPLRNNTVSLRDGYFGVVLSQAVRARLRSHRPGTFRSAELMHLILSLLPDRKSSSNPFVSLHHGIDRKVLLDMIATGTTIDFRNSSESDRTASGTLSSKNPSARP